MLLSFLLRPLLGLNIVEAPEQAPLALQEHLPHKQRKWYLVMCLTGVDYFSSLGYAPGIAMVAAGLAAPFATAMLVLLTFLVMYIYRNVLPVSWKGQGSLSIFAQIVHGWVGKLVVIFLLSFAVEAFLFTISLSSADSAAHIEGNPILHFPQTIEILGIAINHVILHDLLTCLLIALVGALFFAGVEKAIIVTVIAVSVYLVLNLTVVGTGFKEIVVHPQHVSDWWIALNAYYKGNLLMALVDSAKQFPQTALGMSGFETAAAVIVYVLGHKQDNPAYPIGRIVNGKKLVSTAAAIMSFYLMTSIVVTTVLVPLASAEEGGAAHDRVLSFLAHQYLGDGFGSFYDVSTIVILAFAGASAVAGLINLIPIYLPNSGMAPEWLANEKILVSVVLGCCWFITFIFDGSVKLQTSPYATGVLGLLTSGAIGMTAYAFLSASGKIKPSSGPGSSNGSVALLETSDVVAQIIPDKKDNSLGVYTHRQRKSPQITTRSKKQWLKAAIVFSLVTLVLIYTSIANIVSGSSGIVIAGVVFVSLISLAIVSRVSRSAEIEERFPIVEFDEDAFKIIQESVCIPSCDSDSRYSWIIPHDPRDGITEQDYARAWRQVLDEHEPMAYKREYMYFLELHVRQPDDFKSPILHVESHHVGGYRVLRCYVPVVPNAMARILLEIQKDANTFIDVYMHWTHSRGLLGNAIDFFLFGEGDTARFIDYILEMRWKRHERIVARQERKNGNGKKNGRYSSSRVRRPIRIRCA